MLYCLSIFASYPNIHHKDVPHSGVSGSGLT